MMVFHPNLCTKQQLLQLLPGVTTVSLHPLVTLKLQGGESDYSNPTDKTMTFCVGLYGEFSTVILIPRRYRSDCGTGTLFLKM